jgi:hypothetical protein
MHSVLDLKGLTRGVPFALVSEFIIVHSTQSCLLILIDARMLVPRALGADDASNLVRRDSCSDCVDKREEDLRCDSDLVCEEEVR